jgi:hypothetical protein
VILFTVCFFFFEAIERKRIYYNVTGFFWSDCASFWVDARRHAFGFSREQFLEKLNIV